MAACAALPSASVEATLRFQEQLLREVLEREEWNVAAAATALGIYRSKLYRLLETFHIKRPEKAQGET